MEVGGADVCPGSGFILPFFLLLFFGRGSVDDALTYLSSCYLSQLSSMQS